jgi:hypothetical protein
MKTLPTFGCASALLLSAVLTAPAAAQTGATQQALSLHATGTFHGGGEFTGTVAINRFEARDGRVVAVGFVQGVLRRGGQILGSAVTGEVALPVSINSVAVLAGGGRVPDAVQFRKVSLAAVTEPNGRSAGVQETCSVVQIALGPHDVDLLGIEVSLSPIGLSLAGDSAGPLGALVCEVLMLLNNVAGLVGVLNNILALLIGLLGGLTGGI